MQPAPVTFAMQWGTLHEPNCHALILGNHVVMAELEDLAQQIQMGASPDGE